MLKTFISRKFFFLLPITVALSSSLVLPSPEVNHSVDLQIIHSVYLQIIQLELVAMPPHDQGECARSVSKDKVGFLILWV